MRNWISSTWWIFFHSCHWRAIWETIPFIALLSLSFSRASPSWEIMALQNFWFCIALAICLELAQDLRCQKVPWVSEWIWYFNRGCVSLPHLLCISSYCNRSHRWWGFMFWKCWCFCIFPFSFSFFVVQVLLCLWQPSCSRLSCLCFSFTSSLQ